MDDLLTIGALAKRAKVNIDTIRYYERRGLIPATSRRESGYRQYGEDAVKRLHFIKHAKELGFSLNEILELLSLRIDPLTTCGDVRKKVEPKLDEIRGKIQNLQQMENVLKKLIQMCEGSKQASECPILEALDRNIEKERGDMQSLIDRIGGTVKDNVTKAQLNQAEESIRKYILMGFARTGKAPSTAEIMEKSGVSSKTAVDRAIAKLEKNDILLRKDGAIVSAYPFSAKETRHRVIFCDGHEVYALCSTDALGIHFMLDENITVISKCPETEKQIAIVVKDGKIKSCNPKSAVEFISQGEGGCCTAETCCPHMNFFYSREHLDKWIEKNPKYKCGEIYMPNESLRHGKSIFGEFLKNIPNRVANKLTMTKEKRQPCS